MTASVCRLIVSALMILVLAWGFVSRCGHVMAEDGTYVPLAYYTQNTFGGTR